MMKRILIPTDFSENAMNAIKYALELFKNEESEFYLMHAYYDELDADGAHLTQKTQDEITQVVGAKTKKMLINSLHNIRKISTNPKHKFLILSSKSTLVEEVDKLVDDHDIDLIIMGTQGNEEKKTLTFGSHTLQVLKYVQCPVLAIPDGYTYQPPNHLLFPTNYLIPIKSRELKLLNDIMLPFKPEIDLLYISNSSTLSARQEDNRTVLQEGLLDHKINIKQAYQKDIGPTIFEYINEHNVNMLVIVNTKHSFLENILLQSLIDELSLNLKIPFLAMQNLRYC